MLHYFGKRMGLKFDGESLTYIVARYGGHPLLTRMACSFLNTMLVGEGLSRPVLITKEIMTKHEREVEEEIAFYCRHVVSELRLFYPDEYDMLEMLSSGNAAISSSSPSSPNM
jgi:hypothetical protein